MKDSWRWLILLITTLTVGNLQSCKKDLDFNKFNEFEIDGEYGLPLFISSLKIANLIENDTTNTTVDPDGLIRFKFYEDSLFGFALSDYLEIPAQTPSIISASLGLLPLPISTTSDLRTLDELEDQFTLANKNAINAVANTNAIFPSIIDANTTPIALPAHTNFTSVQLKNGFVVIKVTNTLPVRINNLALSVNSLNPTPLNLGSIIFANLDPNQTRIDSFAFINKQVNANWTYTITNVDLASSNPNQVFVDMNKGIQLDFSLSSSLGINGQTKFPSVAFDATAAYINISSADPSQRLRKIEFSSGKIKYVASSQIRENIEVEMDFPGSTLNGLPVPKKIITIPFTGLGINQGEVDISNIAFDLTQKPGMNYSNIYYTYTAKLVGSNSILPFDSSNKFELQLFTGETSLEYAEGFFGTKTLFNDSLEIGLPFLEDISSGLSLDNPSIKFHTRNSIGVPIELDIKLKASNNDGKTQDLNLAPFEIDYPSLAQVGQTIKGTKIVDKNNSDIDKLISLPPHLLNFNIKATGSNGYPNTSNHFIQKEGLAVVGFEMDLPLQIRSNNFSLFQNIQVEFNDPIQASKAELLLKCENGFPLDAKVQLAFLNGLGDTLITINPVQVLISGSINSNGRVISPGNSIASIPLDEEQIKALEKTRVIQLKATLTTANNGSTTVGIYSDYALKIGVSVKAKPKLN
jgi:hypothetical protein